MADAATVTERHAGGNQRRQRQLPHRVVRREIVSRVRRRARSLVRRRQRQPSQQPHRARRLHRAGIRISHRHRHRRSKASDRRCARDDDDRADAAHLCPTPGRRRHALREERTGRTIPNRDDEAVPGVRRHHAAAPAGDSSALRNRSRRPQRQREAGCDHAARRHRSARQREGQRRQSGRRRGRDPAAGSIRRGRGAARDGARGRTQRGIHRIRRRRNVHRAPQRNAARSRRMERGIRRFPPRRHHAGQGTEADRDRIAARRGDSRTRRGEKERHRARRTRRCRIRGRDGAGHHRRRIGRHVRRPLPQARHVQTAIHVDTQPAVGGESRKSAGDGRRPRVERGGRNPRKGGGQGDERGAAGIQHQRDERSCIFLQQR